jgi:hypothetical protein
LFSADKIGRQCQFFGLVALAMSLPWSTAAMNIGEGISGLGILLQWTNASPNFRQFFKKAYPFWAIFFLYLVGLWNTQELMEGWWQINLKHLFFTLPIYLFLFPLEIKYWKKVRIFLLFSVFVWATLALSSLVLPDKNYPWLQTESGYRGGGVYALNAEHPFAYDTELEVQKDDKLILNFQGRNIKWIVEKMDSAQSSSLYFSIPLPTDTTIIFSFPLKGKYHTFLQVDSTEHGVIHLASFSGLTHPLLFQHHFLNAKIPSPWMRRPLAGLLIMSVFLWMLGDILYGKIHWYSVFMASMMLLTLIFLETRMAMIGGLVGLISFIFMDRNIFKKWIFYSIAIGTIVSVFILKNPILNAFQRMNEEIRTYNGINDQLAFGSANKRLGLWKVYSEVGKEHWLLGSGTGDVLEEGKKWLIDQHLPINWLHWPHNQFLTVWVQLGILGLLVWLFFIQKLLFGSMKKHWLPISILVMLSMFTDNTLDTQQGITWVLLMIALGKKE